MTTSRAGAVRLHGAAAFDRLRTAAERLERVRPLYVVALFVVVEWVATLGLALKIRHNGWVYYAGGDQAWFYTTSALLRHGQLIPTFVGYGWSVLLMPFTLVGGVNQLHVLPGIVLLNVLVLMPIAMAAMYGIGERLGGRLFGYWVLLLWLVLPFVGIKYTDAGFKQRYTELGLPDSFGLTSLSDFPCMVMLAVAAYLCLRTLARPAWADAILAGLFAGFAIAIKPSSAVFVVGVAVALLLRRSRVAIAGVAIGLVPELVALAVWKWRGLGYVPLFHAEEARRLALGAVAPPLAALNLHRYLNFDWGQLNNNLGSLQEHFWSARVLEWVVVAGLVGLARLGRYPLLVLGGWFAGYVVVRAANPLGRLEDGSLLHGLVPSIPAFVALVAALPVLVPALARRLRGRQTTVRAWSTPRVRTTAIVAAALLFAVVPVALAGASSRATSGYELVFSGPIPIDAGLNLKATPVGKRVRLTWRPLHGAAGRVSYELVRTTVPTRSRPCKQPWGGICFPTVGVTTATQHVDVPPRRGTYAYLLFVDATWVRGQTGGDRYLSSQPVYATVP